MEKSCISSYCSGDRPRAKAGFPGSNGLWCPRAILKSRQPGRPKKWCLGFLGWSDECPYVLGWIHALALWLCSSNLFKMPALGWVELYPFLFTPCNHSNTEEMGPRGIKTEELKHPPQTLRLNKLPSSDLLGCERCWVLTPQSQPYPRS